jgi:hypothetical protein
MALKDLLLANKARLGAGCLAVFLYLQANPITQAKWYSVLMGLLSAFLLGAGLLKSDSYHKQ